MLKGKGPTMSVALQYPRRFSNESLCEQRTLHSAYDSLALTIPDLPAVCTSSPSDGHRIEVSYQQLVHRSRVLASAMSQHLLAVLPSLPDPGIDAKQLPIALCVSRAHPDFLPLILAASRCNCPFVLMSTDLPDLDLQRERNSFILTQLEPALVVFDKEGASLLSRSAALGDDDDDAPPPPPLGPGPGRGRSPPGALQLGVRRWMSLDSSRVEVPCENENENASASIPHEGAESPESPMSSDRRLLCLMFTGGTQRVKVVKITHGMMLHERQTYPKVFDPGPEGGQVRVLQNLRSFWPAATLGQLSLALAYGGCAVVVAGAAASEPAELRRLVIQEKVDVLGLVPDQLGLLSSEPATELPWMRLVVSWAERLPHAVAERWRGHPRAKLVELLISTEYWLSFSGDPLRLGPDDVLASPAGGWGTVLQPISDVETFVLTKDGRPAAEGEIGELHVYGPMVSPGYLSARDTAAAFTDILGKRCFRTRDLVRVVRGGFIYQGRGDRLAKVNGRFVDMGALEQQLQDAQGIAEACILADARAPSEFHAFVVLHRGDWSSATATASVVSGIRDLLPWRTYLHVLPVLPRHAATGKVHVLDLQRRLDTRRAQESSWPLHKGDGTAESSPLQASRQGLREPQLRERLLATCRCQAAWVLVTLTVATAGKVLQGLFFDAVSRSGKLPWGCRSSPALPRTLSFRKLSPLGLLSMPYAWLALAHAAGCSSRFSALLDHLPLGRFGLLAFLHLASGSWCPLMADAMRLATLVGAGLAHRKRRLLAWPLVFWLGCGGHFHFEAACWVRRGAASLWWQQLWFALDSVDRAVLSTCWVRPKAFLRFLLGKGSPRGNFGSERTVAGSGDTHVSWPKHKRDVGTQWEEYPSDEQTLLAKDLALAIRIGVWSDAREGEGEGIRPAEPEPEGSSGGDAQEGGGGRTLLGLGDAGTGSSCQKAVSRSNTPDGLETIFWRSEKPSSSSTAEGDNVEESASSTSALASPGSGIKAVAATADEAAGGGPANYSPAPEHIRGAEAFASRRSLDSQPENRQIEAHHQHKIVEEPDAAIESVHPLREATSTQCIPDGRHTCVTWASAYLEGLPTRQMEIDCASKCAVTSKSSAHWIGVGSSKIVAKSPTNVSEHIEWLAGTATSVIDFSDEAVLQATDLLKGSAPTAANLVRHDKEIRLGTLQPAERHLLELIDRTNPNLAPVGLETSLLGMDSLRLSMLTNSLQSQLGKAVSSATVREAKWVGQLVHVLRDAPAVTQSAPFLHGNEQSQEFAVWFTPGQFQPMGPWLVRSDVRVDCSALRVAVAKLVHRHSALRASLADPMALRSFMLNCAVTLSSLVPALRSWSWTPSPRVLASRFCLRWLGAALCAAWPRIRIDRAAKKVHGSDDQHVPFIACEIRGGQSELEWRIDTCRWDFWARPPFKVDLLELVLAIQGVWELESGGGHISIVRHRPSDRLVYINPARWEAGLLLSPQDLHWPRSPSGFQALFAARLRGGGAVWLRWEHAHELQVCRQPNQQRQQSFFKASRQPYSCDICERIPFVLMQCFHAYADGYCYAPLAGDLFDYYQAQTEGNSQQLLLPPVGEAFGIMEQRLTDTLCFHSDAVDRHSLRGNIWGFRGPGHSCGVCFESNAVAVLKLVSARYTLPLDYLLLALVIISCARASDIEVIEMTLYVPMRDGFEAGMIGLFADWRDIAVSTAKLDSSVLGVVLEVADVLRLRRWSVFNALRKSERTVVNFQGRDLRVLGGGFSQVPESLWQNGNRLQQPTGERIELVNQPLQFDIQEETSDHWNIYARMAYQAYPQSWSRRFVAALKEAAWDVAFDPLAMVHKSFQGDSF
ncbi:unnamed protein product [Polarella glacialis]|uniref:AMP-dependent synthetase/ligase domain-containing protein n=1 Tax=Polarella glacialis TaxID=89957 RepID=A0A813HCJ4_POLGL|nr:unnamed protein product [Polarella glacialis]